MLEKLKPEKVWYYFEEISKIPRCSKQEKPVRDYIIKVAEEKNLQYNVDQAGNIVIRKGNPDRNTPVLQAHLDMVCEKNSDVEHDFSKDPIKVYIDGDWVKAKGTTLGADNGIGVAAALAALEEDIEPLEVLLTIDEETGLTGASNLSPDFIKGRILLNLDTEEEGEFIIGCAGGRDSVIKFYPEIENIETAGFEIQIKGLKGGHSGMDINTGRANAIKLMANLLYPVIDKIKISRIEGGDKRNAIPRECKATFSSTEEIKDEIYSEWNKLKELYKDVEKEIQVEIFEKNIKTVMKNSAQLINLLIALPHGVISMSRTLPSVVQTSTNLASIHLKDTHIEIVESSRSSKEVELNNVMRKIKSIAELAKAEVIQNKGYPSWEPDSNSFVLKKAEEVYESIFNEKPKTTVIHAGLETGIIRKNIKEMDMISFGPTIKNPHSPDERVNIPSVNKFYNFLIALVKELLRR